LEEKSKKMETALGLTDLPRSEELKISNTNCVPPPSTLAEVPPSPMVVAKEPSRRNPPAPGSGADPTKPQLGKAKAQRRARKLAKQAAAGRIDEAAAGKEEGGRSVDDWLSLKWGEVGSDTPAHVFTTRLVPAQDDNDMFRETFQDSLKIYQNYQQVIHGDPLDKCNASQFKRFLCKSPLVATQGFGSFHQQYLIDGKIVAVGVVDILPRCVSSVYLYYDPAFHFLSLGTLTSLLEIGLVRSLASGSLPSVTSYYLGFYIHSCVKMRYKGRYSPSFLACPETFSWQPLAKCVPLLDQNSYSRLDPDSGARDPEAGGDISEIGVLFLRQATLFGQYRRIMEEEGEAKEDEKEEVNEYMDLVGRSIAKRMLLYRQG